MPIERNLMIEAGAGTGKTTRLVKAVLQALFIRQIPLEEVVALTFTNKAAGELKERVGSALEDVVTAASLDALKSKPWWPSPDFHLPLSDLKSLAQTAMGVLDRANISTIHSFAFALLKRFPLAAGIDPNAEIDDKGLRFDDYFRQEWPAWLTVELADKSPREALWMELLSKLALSQVEEAARKLADFEVPLEHLVTPTDGLAARLKVLHAGVRELCAAHTGGVKADDVAKACEEVIGAAANAADSVPNSVVPAGRRPGPIDNRPRATDSRGDELKAILNQSLSATKQWPKEDIARLKTYKAIALNCLAGGDRVITLLTTLLSPFIRHFRDVLLTEGCLTHAALLHLSRNVVKDHPEIRAALKRSIRLILIDEFQDTDPLQAELLLYLAEMHGRHALAWEEVKLESGKLFIVGDPKQSIYRFRGADIAAYERIGELVIRQGGSRETLEVNYRSQAQVIEVVNRAFEKIILPEPEISPPYIAVKSHHARDPQHAVQDVEIWLAGSPDAQSVEEAQATEAHAIAHWIKQSAGDLTVYDPREGKRRPLLYRDVSLIFRTYSPMDRFIEALRREGIPFAVESERYFFTTPEVTDFVNLLRAAENPDDMLSLVGYLRSPMGGLTDEEILRLRLNGTLSFSSPRQSVGRGLSSTSTLGPGLQPAGTTEVRPQAKAALEFITTITQRLRREPLADVLQHIFNDTYLMELAARSYHGDQTVANLLKLRRLLETFAAEGVTTMGLLLKKLEEFFNDDKIEGENPLADENYNAVRLLTIHKAKGLEYPVVFLPSLSSELKTQSSEMMIYDWRKQKLGLRIGDYANLEKFFLDEQTRRREAAEENRILYVAMTRARERLVLSGGVNLKSSRKQTYLQRLMGAWDLTLEELVTSRMDLGDTSIAIRRLDRITASDEPAAVQADESLLRIDAGEFADAWRKRKQKCEKAEGTLLVTTPTTVGAGLVPARGKMKFNPTESDPMDLNPTDLDSISFPDDGHFRAGTRPAPTLLGTLVHRFLESWDFTCEKCSMPAALRRTANTYFATEGLLLEPFPDPKDGDKTNNPPEIVAIVDEAQRLLADFIGSDAWEEIKSSEILGREVPFFYGTAPMMRGTMDILYRRPDGTIVIGDYKTGQTKQDYAAQDTAYREAVIRAMGEQSIFKIIALREDN